MNLLFSCLFVPSTIFQRYMNAAGDICPVAVYFIQAGA